jgi:inner membrane protein
VSLAGVTLGVAGFGGFVGAYAILAHLAGDIITPAGVPLFWPLPTNVSLSLVGADNTVANYGLLGAGVVATAGVLVAAGPV